MNINRVQVESSDWLAQNRQYMVDVSFDIASVVEQHLDLSSDRKGKMPKIKRSSLARIISRSIDEATPRRGKRSFPSPKDGLRNRAAKPSQNAPHVDTGNSNNYQLFQLVARFNLSDTEVFVILVCMAVELIPSFSRLWATYHGDTNRTYPTWGAVASLFDCFDSRAMGHDSSLEAWQLIRVKETDNLSYNEFPLFIDLDIYNYLLGKSYSDRTLKSLIKSVSHNQQDRLSSERPNTIVDQAVTLFRRSLSAMRLRSKSEGLSESFREQYGSCVQLSGTDDVQKRSIVTAIANKLNGGYLELNHFKVPTTPEQLHSLSIRLERWMKLTGNLLYIKADCLETEDKGRTEGIKDLLDTVEFPIVISTIEPMDWGVTNILNEEVSVPNSDEQVALWRTYLPPQLLGSLDADLPILVSQFNLSAPAIKTIAQGLDIDLQGKDSAFDTLWSACRIQARQRLDSLAKRVESKASWDNLILPHGVKNSLNDIVAQTGLKNLIYRRWDMGGARGLGITALFAGTSGTGKTTAAELIANELKLDLYKIDLSTVISKYIGETEKNLRKIFDAAEAGGAILLFDEADALFGKRTEVKDSKDRHSNTEISYLLQKMEAYSGLAILTTNLPDAIDSAFKRRLRFVVDFAYPDADAQEKIWRSAFGTAAPTIGLDYQRLAELNLTGGNIRSVALNAAFKAGQDGEAIGMKHVVSAAFAEAKKLGNATHHLEALKLKLNLDLTRNSDGNGSDAPNNNGVERDMGGDRSRAEHQSTRTEENRSTHNAECDHRGASAPVSPSGATRTPLGFAALEREASPLQSEGRTARPRCKSREPADQTSSRQNTTNPEPTRAENNPTQIPTNRTKTDPFSQTRNPNPVPDRDYSKMSPQEILDSTAPSLRNNDHQSACSILRDALAYYPDHSGLNFWLGHTNYKGKLNLVEAATAFERAEAGNGQWLNNPEGEKANWYWQAVVIFDLGRRSGFPSLSNRGVDMPQRDLQRVCELCSKYIKAMPDGIYTTKAREKHALARRQIILPDFDE